MPAQLEGFLLGSEIQLNKKNMQWFLNPAYNQSITYNQLCAIYERSNIVTLSMYADNIHVNCLNHCTFLHELYKKIQCIRFWWFFYDHCFFSRNILTQLIHFFFINVDVMVCIQIIILCPMLKETYIHMYWYPFNFKINELKKVHHIHCLRKLLGLKH